MDEQESNLGEAELRKDLNEDYYQDQMPTNFNLRHLSLSETVMKFFLTDKDLLADFMPLADQIMATNCLVERDIRIYKNIFDSMIIERSMRGGLSRRQHGKLDTARLYMHQLIDGCRKGYRGALVTERVYKVNRNDETQERKGALRR